MRVLLVQPPAVSLLGLSKMALMEPLALERLAAALSDEDVALLDLRVDPDLEAGLRRHRPDLIGITCPFTIQANMVLDVAARAKRLCPEALVLIGGPHPSLRPQDFAREGVDAIVCGEGEQTLAEVVQCLHEGGDLATVPGLIINQPDGCQHATGIRAHLTDLDQLPLPARHLTAPWRKHYYWMDARHVALVETSRGCSHRCNYCSVPRFNGGNLRLRSAENIVAEIAGIGEEWIGFCDDNFLLDVERAGRVAELIRAAGIRKRYSFQARSDTVATHPDLIKQWRDIGLRMVLMGLDRADDAGLAALHKRNSVRNNATAVETLKDLGIMSVGNFVVDPEWEVQDFTELKDYVRRHTLMSSFTILTPLPATPLFDELEGQLTTREWEYFDLCHAVLPTRLPVEEFYRQYAGLWRDALSPTRGLLTYRWLLRELWDVVAGGAGVAHLQRVQRVYRMMSNPATYLNGHHP